MSCLSDPDTDWPEELRGLLPPSPEDTGGRSKGLLKPLPRVAVALVARAVLVQYGAWHPNPACPEIPWISEMHFVLTPQPSQEKDSNITYQLFVWEAFPTSLQMQIWRTVFILSDSWVIKCLSHLECYINPSVRKKLEKQVIKREK